MNPITLASLLGLPTTSPEITTFLSALSSSPSSPLKTEIKPYPDGTFHNYPQIGLSFFFVPPPPPSSSSSGPSSFTHSNKEEERILDRMDIYNPPPPPPSTPSTPKSRRNHPKSSYHNYSPPPLPIPFHLPTDHLFIPSQNPAEPSQQIPRPEYLMVGTETRGKEFVAVFGEPDKKGGRVGFVPFFVEWGRVELVVPLSRLCLDPFGKNGEGIKGEDEDGDEGGAGRIQSETGEEASEGGGERAPGGTVERSLEANQGSICEGEDMGEAGKRERETIHIGIMVELRDPGPEEIMSMTEAQKAKGLGGVWERAGEWVWGSIKIFRAE